VTGPRIIRPDARRMINMPLKVGESPTWDERTGDLWFVDIGAPAVFCLRADGRLNRFEMPAVVGCLGLCESSMIVLCLRTGVHLLDPATGAITLLCDPDDGRPDSRLNDGKIGPDGHLWVGTRDEAIPQTGNARLYRVAPDGSFSTIVDGLKASNGLAWSGDGRRMYHSDSNLHFLRAYDFDPATGALGPARHLVELGEARGRPDGAATDEQGFYWSAGVSAGRLNRISPEGDIVEIYEMPVAAPTMPCFGGPELRTIYVTSLSTSRTGRPEDGTLLAFDVDVAGVPIRRFAR
jgi:sugar lactone lactonase YvrE